MTNAGRTHFARYLEAYTSTLLGAVAGYGYAHEGNPWLCAFFFSLGFLPALLRHIGDHSPP